MAAEPVLNPAAAERAREEVARMLRQEGNRARARENHQRFMGRALRRNRRNYKPVPRGSAPTYPEWFADVMHDENEAVPPATRWERDQEDPVVGEDCWLWGASLTCHPERRMPEGTPVFDFTAEDLEELHDWLAAEPPERPVAKPKPRPRSVHTAEVEACLREYGEPLLVADVVTLTGLSKLQVWHALRSLEEAHVVKRERDWSQAGRGRPRELWSVIA